ncbi:hypothetical protein GWO43_26620 [candidate division KSB1 bacterium]|nr:hypothetical protein [candidate division KSB1 bacterium]NIR70099.1 hypothetical protein [candidate division KSB1 bacterium]NIS27524.1 hypothetical protein [candidate division KSB1 bacterium]NIT74375.1 hypothetical protein [candidate division KSB1 bacterium]NIU28242.1 hypothetical protein [candidate division KSB1 bacterium]
MKSKYSTVLALMLLLYPNTDVLPGWKISTKPVKFVGGDGETYLRPVWSPDDKWIAFTKPGYKGIWIKHVESGELKQISDEPAAGFGFSWANNSSAIASRVARFEGRKRINEVKVFDLVDESSHVISDSKMRFRGLPRWSHDDQFIYILGKRNLFVFESGMKVTSERSISPNHEMYYLKSGKIIVEKAELKSKHVYEPIKGMRYINLTVSPDRTKFAFEVIGGSMHVMNSDGTNLVNLGTGYRPQWSPDSQYLVYMITEDDGHRFTQSDIYAIKIDGSEKSKLTDTNNILEMNPNWSPVSKRIAFDTYVEGAIYLVAIEKSN